MKLGLVAFSDFQRYPVGGTLSFLREFSIAASDIAAVEISLVGWSSTPIRQTEVRGIRVGTREHSFIAVGGGIPPRVIPDRTVFHANSNGWREAMSLLGHVDTLYCHSPEAVLGAVRGGARSPIAMHLHGARDAIGRSRFLVGRLPPVKWLYRHLVLEPALLRADAVLATISEDEHRKLQASGLVRAGVPCVRIPGMVSSKLGESRPKSPGGAIRMVCVGRIESVKGIELPIAALAVLVQRGIKCHLDIVGGGADQKRLERLVRERGLAGFVTFCGRLEPDEVARYLGAADVFVSGSLQEGFSLALLEALVVGTPAVVTMVGSARDVIVTGSTGEVVSGRDPERFADAVQSVARYSGDCSRACHEMAMCYSSRRISGQVLEILEEISHRPAGTSTPPPDPVVSTAGVGL